MAKTLLIVDDKANLRVLLRDYLSKEGYRVVTAGNGQEALHTAQAEEPDLILLDIMMPEMDGYDFIRTYRQNRATPIILLTAKLEEMDKVIGLELGADDYMTKPFGMRELVARVRAVLRRTDSLTQPSTEIAAGGVVLNLDMHRVSVRGRPVGLTPSEFALLATLMRAPGRVYSRMELLDALPGDAFSGAERTVDVHIRHLRKKIEEDPSEPRLVQTVFGVGYRFRLEQSA